MIFFPVHFISYGVQQYVFRMSGAHRSRITLLDIAWNAYHVSYLQPPRRYVVTFVYTQCDINETVILENAKYVKAYGLAVSLCKFIFWSAFSYFDICYLAQDVGYTYINIDDCYSEKNRSASGDIVASASFPSTTTVVVY